MRNIISILILILTTSISVRAAELNVPDDFTTLKLAIQAASNNDIITIAGGNYSGSSFSDLAVSAKTITIRSAQGQVVAINCNGSQSVASRFITVSNGAEVSLQGVSVLNGYHSSGAAILVIDGQLALEDCVFNNCRSDGAGGSIYISGTATGLEILRCSFTNGSSANNGGAIAIDGEISVSIVDSVFSGNTSVADGGALYIGHNTSGIIIDRCNFTKNYAGEIGGAIAIDFCSDFEISNSLVAGNRSDSYGGGIYISNSNYSTGNANDNTIATCTITENKSNQSGGGLNIFNTDLFIANSIIYSNIISNTNYYMEFSVAGGSSRVKTAHCVIRGYDEFFNDDMNYNPIYNFIEIGSTLEDLGGNIDADPEFTQSGVWNVNTWTEGNYQPIASSYCYNNGLNDYNDTNSELDLNGQERIQANYIDIGCYEREKVSGGDLTGTMDISLRFPDEIIPGDRGKCVLTMDNIGDEDLNGTFPIKLYLSANKYIDDNDILLAESKRDVRVRMLVARPRSMKYTLAITIPGDIAAGDYYLLAYLDSNNSLPEADNSINSNVIISDPQTINWKFGNFGNRKNAVLTLNDALGVENRYVLKFGEGEIAANRSDINIISESENCMLTITPRTRGAVPELGNINCEGSFSLNAKKCDLAGDITVSGIMPKLIIGNILYSVSPVVVTVSGSTDNPRSAMLLQASNVSDLNLFSENYPINAIKVNNWTNNSGSHPQIVSTWLGSLVCKEDFEADITLSGNNATRDIAIKSASVKGNINNSLWQINGNISKIAATTVNGFTLLVGTKPGITEPTGSELNDIDREYSLTMALSGTEACMTNSTIICWEFTRLTFKRGSYATNTDIEYFYSRRPLTAPDNANIITATPASGQELEIPLIPNIWRPELYNYFDLF